MRLHHERDLDAPLDRVWERAKDVRTVAAAFPGGEITSTDGDAFTGRVTVGMGPLRMTYDGTGRVSEIHERSHRATITATGTQRFGPGHADIRMTLCLHALDDTHTRALLDTDLTVMGSDVPLAGPLGERIAAPLVGEFLQRLGDEQAPESGGHADIVGSFLRHFGSRRS